MQDFTGRAKGKRFIGGGGRYNISYTKNTKYLSWIHWAQGRAEDA